MIISPPRSTLSKRCYHPILYSSVNLEKGLTRFEIEIILSQDSTSKEKEESLFKRNVNFKGDLSFIAIFLIINLNFSNMLLIYINPHYMSYISQKKDDVALEIDKIKLK